MIEEIEKFEIFYKLYCNERLIAIFANLKDAEDCKKYFEESYKNDNDYNFRIEKEENIRYNNGENNK
jgi:hypothetical protein